jgi:hypothetical protein
VTSGTWHTTGPLRPRLEHDRAAAREHARAWLLLVGALALHVIDEASTGFLDFYNPLVLRIRSQIGWFPMPTFARDIWITGLALLILVLAALAPIVRRGPAGIVAASYVFSAIMLLNGAGHLGGSVYFARWLPGATTAPLLIVASVVLVRAAAARVRSGAG